MSDGSFLCEVCNKKLASAKTFRAHLLTKTHGKNVSLHDREEADRVQRTPDLSLHEFKTRFGERVLSDLVKSNRDDVHFDINEIQPWLGLESSDVIALIRKIFHETLERSDQGDFEPRSFGLNQFKMLLIAARSKQSHDSFEFMKAIRSARREKR